MAIPTSLKTVGTVYTLAAQTHLQKMIQDNYLVNCPAYVELRKNKHNETGGETLVVPVELGGTPLGGALARTENLNMQDSENISQAEYPWAVYAEPIVINDQDKWRAQGNEFKLIDIVKSKTNSALKKLKTKVFTAIYGASPTAKELLGLPSAIATTPASSGSYGNLDGGASAQPSWRNYDLSLGSFGSGGIAGLTTMFRTLADQSSVGKPTAAFTSSTVWGYLHAEAQNSQEIQRGATNEAGQAFANLGFEVVTFMGTPIIADPYSTSDALYAINSSAIELVEKAGMAFQLHEAGFVHGMSNGQLAMVSAVVWMGQICTLERRGLGKLYAITA